MNQLLHIFRKDARRFWPEIAVSLALLAAEVWAGPYAWRPTFLSPGHFPSQKTLALFELLPLLVVITWGLLITRVVQAESLVGDTQFWLTRPYDWKRLLAAKVLFVGVFVYVPVVVVQCVLLMRAGFHPLSLAGSLVYNLLLITGTLVVPIFAIACVTSSLARVVLTVLGILGCIAAFSALTLLWQPLNGAVLPSTLIPQLLCLGLGVVAIVLQYATRRALVARLVLLSVPVLLFVVSEVGPYSIDRVYARQDGGDHASIKLAYSPRPNEGFPASLRSTKEVVFGVPVNSVEVPDHTIPVIENARMTMEAADGSRWVSPWEGMWGAVIGEGTKVTLSMPRAVYDRFKGKPLTFELTLAVAEGREQSSARIPLSSQGSVAVMGEGICSATSSLSADSDYNHQQINSQCIYPLRQPQLTRVALLYEDPACNPTRAGSWSGSHFGGLAYFSISPIWVGSNSGQELSYPVSRNRLPTECLASGIMFAQYELAARLETTVTIPNFELPSLWSGN